MGDSLEKPKRPWRWPLRIVVIGCALYFSRSFWPMFFQGEPYAEIEAAIPPDMTLRVGASYRSSSCTEMTFSDFSQIPGGKGWSKEYTPDSQGKVTAKVYQRTIGPCNWYLNGFSVSTVYHEIPANILAIPSVSDEIKNEITQQFSDVGSVSHGVARLNFNIDYQSSEPNNVGDVTLSAILTPSILKKTIMDNSVHYMFLFYEKQRTPSDLFAMENLVPYGREGSLKINYHVEVDNHALLKELYPSSDKNTSKIIQ